MSFEVCALDRSLSLWLSKCMFRSHPVLVICVMKCLGDGASNLHPSTQLNLLCKLFLFCSLSSVSHCALSASQLHSFGTHGDSKPHSYCYAPVFLLSTLPMSLLFLNIPFTEQSFFPFLNKAIYSWSFTDVLTLLIHFLTLLLIKCSFMFTVSNSVDHKLVGYKCLEF